MPRGASSGGASEPVM